MIIVDPEFESLIPPLTEEEFKQLEENILRDGIRDPLCLWRNAKGEDILIDGHNRFKIAAQHGGIQFQTKYIMCADREVAKQWIIRNQFGRRNLTNFQRSELALKLKPTIQEEARQRQRSHLPKSGEATTEKKLGALAGVGKDTIRKVEHILDKGSEETKAAARSGQISVNEAYKRTVKENEPPKPDIPTVEEEHEAFVEKKNTAPAVSIDEIKEDKERQRLIAIDTSLNIRKAIWKMEDLMTDEKTSSIAKVSERTKALTQEEKQYLISRMQSILNFANGIIRALRGD